MIAQLAQQIQQIQTLPKVQPLAFIQPMVRGEQLPVSFAQERVFFLEQLAPNRAYQFQSTLRLQGDLNLQVLEQSLTEMIRRHEIFRTTLPAIEGHLVQVIHPPYAVTVPIIDLQELSSAEQDQKIPNYLQSELNKPFDIKQLPLIRWTLLKLGPQDYILIHVEHYMVHDGWSFNLFLREWQELYRAFIDGKPSSLPEPSVQFVDFAHWQREWVKTDAAQRQLDYWVKTLSGSPPLLELPYDRTRPAQPTYKGGKIPTELPLPLCLALRNVSRQAGHTLFMTLFAAFLVLLHRYTSQDDLNVATAVANRRVPGSEGLIGMIVNNLVLRTNLSGNPSFMTLLDRVKQVTLEGYANEDLPFDLIVDALNPMRDMSYNPLFQVMFSFHDSPLGDLDLPGLKTSLNETVENKSAKFDLDVLAIPRWERQVGQGTAVEDEGILMMWEYSSDLFDEATIRRMMGHYQTLLEAIVEQPSQTITQLPLLSSEQRHQVLIGWNNTKPLDEDKELSVHQLFEAQVNETPGAIALCMGEEQLTYEALNAKANQLARHLQTLGVETETLVGLCVDRSFDLIVGLLAILKAGGAYVPLDPAYPMGRLRYMIDDAQLSILVTNQSIESLLLLDSITVVDLGTDRATLEQYSSTDLESSVTLQQLAYVMYTSGSTGQPKGVMIEQRNLTNFVQSAVQHYGIQPSDRVLQFASISFDTAAEEIYPCLISGATLILRTEEMIQSISAFVKTSAQFALTIWNLPTAYWHVLCSELEPMGLSVPDSIRAVIIGGERAIPEKVTAWLDKTQRSVQLFNSYGPTETTVVATLCQLQDSPGPGQPVPIGRPIANVKTYVLDKRLQPVPVGVPGELYIGGAGVARGYFQQPELTQSRFFPDPFSQDPDGKMYQTGDQVCYRSDGVLEFLGRLDHQVKIRGFRVELGEIETFLNQQIQIAQSVVVAREDTPGTKRLVGYLVPKGQEAIAPDDIRQLLKDQLPGYMVPASFVVLEQLPFTPSGKIDYHALPAPDSLAIAPENSETDPCTWIESQLKTVWADVLGLAQVGIYDNFFQLGGDSIVSIQMIARAAQAGLHFTPKQLFQHQTVSQLATVVETTRTVNAQQGLVTGPVSLTPIQHWFFQDNLPEPHHFNQSILVQLNVKPEAEMLQKVVQHLLLHHDSLRLTFQREPDQWQGIQVAELQTIPLEIEDLSHFPAHEQIRVLREKSALREASLDLSSGILLAVTWFKLGQDTSDYLLLVVHHLAVDGISWRIILEDIDTLYQQIAADKVIQLPPKTTAVQDWSKHLLNYATTQTLAAEMSYWLVQGEIPKPQWPKDFEGDFREKINREISATASVEVKLAEDLTCALLQDVPSVYNTRINDVLLTALIQCFRQWTGDSNLLIDLEGHGREDLFEDVDLSRTVGWFTTLFPIQLSLNSDDPGTALKSIKEQLRQIPQSGIGYGVLRYLHPQLEIREQLATASQSLVSFNYLGQFERLLLAPTRLGRIKELKSDQSDRGHRSHLFGISGWIRQGQLEMRFEYSDRLYKQATLETLANNFMNALTTLITHCQQSTTSNYTPSDFSASNLDQKQLNKLMARRNKKNNSKTPT